MRVLGPDGYGTFTVSVALAGTVLLLGDLGAMEYMVRELARRPDQTARFFVNLGVGRLVLSAAATVLTLAVGWAMSYGPAEMAALMSASLFIVAARGIEFCRGIFRAFEVLRFEAGSVIMEKGMVIAIGMVGLLWSRSAWGVLLGMGLGAVVTLALSVRTIDRNFASLSNVPVDCYFLVVTHRAALPIGAFAMATFALLFYAPVVIEAHLGDMEAGTYGAAFRIIEACMLLPSAFAAATLPRLSNLHHSRDHISFRRLLSRASVSLFTLACVASGALWAVAHPLILVLGGADFSAAGALLQWMAIALVPMAMTALWAPALISSDDHWFAAGVVALAAVINALICWIALSRWGLLAPVISLLLCHILITSACGVRLFALHKR